MKPFYIDEKKIEELTRNLDRWIGNVYQVSTREHYPNLSRVIRQSLSVDIPDKPQLLFKQEVIHRKENLKKIEEALDTIGSAEQILGIKAEKDNLADRLSIAEFRLQELFTAVSGLAKDLKQEIEREENS